jgi:hypothetical protein
MTSVRRRASQGLAALAVLSMVPLGIVVFRIAGAMNRETRLCLARPDCGPKELVEALQSGRATPETLFDWAISRRASDLVRTARLPLWDDYVEHGNFARATLDALLHRAAPAP